MALAAVFGWHIIQIEFIAVYLNDELEESLFMEEFPMLAESFRENQKKAEIFGYVESMIIELRKPVYGLKQASATW